MARKIGKLIAYFWENGKLQLARAMEYRLNFLVETFISLAFSSIGPVLQYLIFSQTKGFPGWNLKQIILFQGTVLFILGLRDVIFGGLRYLVVGLIRKGDFDRLLLKPYPTIGVILASGFNLNGIGSVIAGIGIIIYSLIQMKLPITLPGMSLFIAFIVFGMILYMGWQTLYTAAVVMLVHMGRLDNILDALVRFGEYPLDIYSKTLRIIFMTVAPLAMWVYFPAKALLGFWDTAALYAILFCLLFFLVSLKLWGLCLKKYTSAGG